MNPDDVNELDEKRPTLEDGNLFMVYLRTGNYDRAKVELTRLERSYSETPGRSGKDKRNKKEWVVWCRTAARVLASVPQEVPTET